MNKKISGIVLIIVGLGLVVWGYQMSGSISSKFTEALSGSPADAVMWRYIAGAVCLVVGGTILRR